MLISRKIFLAIITLLTYGTLLCISANANPQPEPADSILPEPGTQGDTLNIVDKRMAYLVYQLLDKNGKIKGANIKRGEKLFYQNCRGCHGEDGRRVNFTPGETPTYIGDRARKDMPTFWYQMNFGDDERGMEPYIDEIPLDEMVDIAGFAQTLR